MTLVSVPQVNPNDEITADSSNKGPNAIAAVVNGNLDDTNVSGLSGSKIAAGTLPAAAMTADANPETRMSETLGNSIASGCVWSTLSGLNAAMTSGVAYVQGKRLTVAAVTSTTFMASRDTYVYITNAGAVSYDAQANGATQPATPGTAALVAKVVTGASAITSIQSMPDAPVTGSKINYSTLPLEGSGGSSSTNTATSYGALSTPVSITVDVPSTGNVALILSARLYNTSSSDQTGFVSFVASGANTIAASDANAISAKVISGNSDASYARVKYLTGLTPGSTTFTLHRRTTGGSLQVVNADLVVIPMS